MDFPTEDRSHKKRVVFFAIRIKINQPTNRVVNEILTSGNRFFLEMMFARWQASKVKLISIAKGG